MRRQISLILFCLLVLTAVSSGQERLPKKTPQVVGELLDSVIRARGYDPLSVSITADTLARFIVTERILANPKALIYVRYYQSRGHQYDDLYLYGTFISLDPPKAADNFTVMAYIGNEPKIVTVAPRQEPPAPSFWESTMQPALVTLGAVAIIALFFLIRS